MTPEQEKVLEAALALIRCGRQCLGHWEGSKFISRGEVPLVPERWDALDDAVRAYRKSLEPKPRYYVKDRGEEFREAFDRWAVMELAPIYDGAVAYALDKAGAERIAALLNESERKP